MKTEKCWLTAALILCAASLIMMTLVCGKTEKQEVHFIPPPFEENACAGIPEVPEDDPYGKVDAKVFSFSLCPPDKIQDGKARIFLTNPPDSPVWIKLRALDSQGAILGETGILRPGEYTEYLSFSAVPKEGEDLYLKVMAYEPETYYSAGSVQLTIHGS